MPTIYHLSPDNFDMFSSNRTGNNFGDQSKKYNEPGSFFAPNMAVALDWSKSIAYSKGNMGAGYRRLVDRFNKSQEENKDIFPPFRTEDFWKYLYLYQISVNRNDLEKWIESADPKESYWAPEIFVPASDFNKLQIIGKKKYLSEDLFSQYRSLLNRPKSHGYEEYMDKEFFSKEKLEEEKRKQQEKEEVETSEFYDELLKKDKEKRKRQERSDAISDRFNEINSISRLNWYRKAKLLVF